MAWQNYCALSLAAALCISGCGGGGGGEDSETDFQPASASCDVLAGSLRIIDGASCSAATSAIVRLRIIDRANLEEKSCSGTLVEPRTVLTAAHCLLDLESDDITAVLPTSGVSIISADGSSTLARASRLTVPDFFISDIADIASQLAEEGEPFDVDSERFVDLLFDKGARDFAFVHLDRALNLPTLPIITSRLPQQSESLAIYGYGVTTPDGTFDDLPNTLIGGFIDADRIGVNSFGDIFESGQSNTCRGDSGGPVVALSPVLGIIGITSLGLDNCAPGELSVFTATGGRDVKASIEQTVPNAAFR